MGMNAEKCGITVEQNLAESRAGKAIHVRKNAEADATQLDVHKEKELRAVVEE